jgi:O-antigen ligase
MALENPLEVARLDGSLNDRVSAVYYSLKGFFLDNMRPHTYGEYSELLMREVPNSSYFWYITINDRIKSYYGSILFELGFIGFLYIVVFSYFIYEFYKWRRKAAIVFVLFFNAILFSAIPLSMPYIPLYLASLYVNKKYNRKEET